MTNLNFKLNPGGIIGAIVLTAVVIGFIAVVSRSTDARAYMISGLTLIGGAAAGNALWAKAFNS